MACSCRLTSTLDDNSGAILNSAIYDSVAVVRGATGLLIGAGDPGASVNVVRKRPTSEFQGSVEAGLGRWDKRRLVADVGGPLNTAGTLRGRVVAGYDEAKSWVDRYKGDNHVFYGVLDADLGDRTVLSLSLERSQEKSKATPWAQSGMPLIFTDGTLTPFDRHDNNAADWARWKKQDTAFSAALEHAFNDDWNVKLRYGHTKRDSYAKRSYIYNFSSDMSAPIGGTGQITDREENVDGLDIRLNGRYSLWGRQHQLVAGFNGSRLKSELFEQRRVSVADAAAWMGDSSVRWTMEPDWAAVTNQGPSKTTVTQWGTYLATQFKATDRLSLIVGGRWSSWKIKSVDLPGSPYYDDGIPYIDRKENSFVPYGGVVYDLTPNLSAYTSYTEIFKPQYRDDVNGNQLDPLAGKNYEIGLKGEWFDGRLNASAAVFELRQDNLPVLDDGNLNPSGGYAYRAEDHTKTRGWELEVAGELSRGWSMQAGYSRATIRDSKGGRLNTHTPIHQFKLFSSYTPASLPKLTVGGGLYWQSKNYSTNYDAYGLRDVFTVKGYTLVNLMGRYAFNDHLSLTVNLNNAFNKNYRVDTGGHTYGPERNIHATLKYRF
ncbi:TonB-dependent siderophore receptor [Thauera sp. SDU_THAU2]|uniref:TonB-dependent siderophore receptor n=1 Tax=Thauera sp. SDU_THAU2 TaxID=3136633 RepID=UPI00311D2D45